MKVLDDADDMKDMTCARVGRTLGLTLYAQLGAKPGKADTFLGTFNTRELAQIAADGLNGQRRETAPWRALGRLIYPQRHPIDLDDFYGAMVSREVAAQVVTAVNGYRVPPPPQVSTDG